MQKRPLPYSTFKLELAEKDNQEIIKTADTNFFFQFSLEKSNFY